MTASVHFRVLRAANTHEGHRPPPLWLGLGRRVNDAGQQLRSGGGLQGLPRVHQGLQLPSVQLGGQGLQQQEGREIFLSNGVQRETMLMAK